MVHATVPPAFYIATDIMYVDKPYATVLLAIQVPIGPYATDIM
jgi:hypothetical protein